MFTSDHILHFSPTSLAQANLLVSTDAPHQILTTDDGLHNLLGFHAQEALGRSLRLFFGPETDAPALLGAVKSSGAFHRPDAAGYVFWSQQVAELDAINPQVAARLARTLDRWAQLAEPYRSGAREALLRVAAKPDLSNDVREVIDRALSL